MAFQRSVPVQLEAGEQPVRDMRRHGIILLGRILPPLVVSLVPVGLILVSRLMYRSDPGQAQAMFSYSLLALVLLGLPMLVWALVNGWDWANDSFHITTKRVIRSEQHWWISTTVISAGLGQIQNVAVFVPDLLANLLNYGTVIIETAAQEGRIEFDSIHDPHAIQRLIFELRGVPAPPEEPAQPIGQGLRELLAALFPFFPQHRPDGSVVYHKHWYVLTQALRVPVFLLALVVLGVWLLDSLLPLLALLGIVPMLVYQYVNWVNDVYILTENRIIDIVRIPLIREDRREALLQQIQNVQVTIPNFMSRVLDMGDVFVETAGKAENFLFRTVHHPADVAAELNRRLDAVRSSRRQAEQQARRQEIEDIVGEIMQAQKGGRPPAGATPPGS